MQPEWKSRNNAHLWLILPYNYRVTMGRDKAFDPPSQTKLLFSNSMGSPVANSRFSLFIAFDDNFTMGAFANCFGKDKGGVGWWLLTSRLFNITMQPNGGFLTRCLRYIRLFVHVLQLLSITFNQLNLCCFSKSMMKHHHKSNSAWFSYGYWKCMFVDSFFFYNTWIFPNLFIVEYGIIKLKMLSNLLKRFVIMAMHSPWS